jgi:hypothetical protein
MAPRLKLPENFRVRTFGSSRNINGISKYLMPPVHVNSDLLVPSPRVAHVQRSEEITHVSETCLSDSRSRPVPRDYPTSEPTVRSEEQIDPDYEVTSGGGEASKTRKTLDVRVSAVPTRKKKKNAAKTVTRR